MRCAFQYTVICAEEMNKVKCNWLCCVLQKTSQHLQVNVKRPSSAVQTVVALSYGCAVMALMTAGTNLMNTIVVGTVGYLC